MASGGARHVTGVIVGTGADLTVTKVGFRPRTVWIVNKTDPGFATWSEPMPDDSMIKQVDGTSTNVTSNGITPSNSGFALGADADMNVDGEQLFYQCWE
jgi:hypothetical protein